MDTDIALSGWAALRAEGKAAGLDQDGPLRLDTVVLLAKAAGIQSDEAPTGHRSGEGFPLLNGDWEGLQAPQPRSSTGALVEASIAAPAAGKGAP